MELCIPPKSFVLYPFRGHAVWSSCRGYLASSASIRVPAWTCVAVHPALRQPQASQGFSFPDGSPCNPHTGGVVDCRGAILSPSASGVTPDLWPIQQANRHQPPPSLPKSLSPIDMSRARLQPRARAGGRTTRVGVGVGRARAHTIY